MTCARWEGARGGGGSFGVFVLGFRLGVDFFCAKTRVETCAKTRVKTSVETCAKTRVKNGVETSVDFF